MKRTFPNAGSAPFLAFLLFVTVLGWTGGAYAQSQSVRGTVVSAADKQPLIGVAVVVKGTSTGTSTGADGAFALGVPETGDVLTISFLGYKTQEVKIAGRTEINIALEEDNTSLDEVVVIGYGVQKKKLTTGANLNVKGDDLIKRNTASPLQALQGQTPGVQITAQSGQPGSTMKVTIRGLGTNQDASPLYVIDGMTGGDITKINPADIQSVDVLKDAASAAIYGAQAANGVILVTTRTGQKGSAQVYYDGYYGIQTVARKVNMLNASQYKMIMDEQAVNGGGTVNDWASMGELANTNWVNKIFKNAPTQSHTAGITGGTDRSVYAVSFNYSDQAGIIGGKDKSNYTRYSFRTNTEHKLYGDLLKVGEHFNFIHTESTSIGEGNMYDNSMRGALNTSPLQAVYGTNPEHAADPDGKEFDSSIDSPWNTNDGNPYASIMTGRTLSKKMNVVGDVYLELQPVRNLRLRSSFGINYSTERSHTFSPAHHYSAATQQDNYYGEQFQYNGYNLTWTNTLQYDFTVAHDHAFNVMVGSEWLNNDGEQLWIKRQMTKEQFLDFDHAWISNGTGDIPGTGEESLRGKPDDVDRTMSIFGRIGYNYKEKYMLNVTFRADGSSRFADGHRWGYFPSVSAGWVMTEENFMRNQHALDFLKLRASWGQVGNKNIGMYKYTAGVKWDANYVYGTGLENTSGSYVSTLPNPDITWETSEQLDLGFDARFLGNRLELNFDWYRKTTRDWLVDVPLLATTGYETKAINGGDVRNSGVEVSLGWRETRGEFSYYLTGNFSYNKNKVLSVPNEDGVINGSVSAIYNGSSEIARVQTGYAMGYWRGYKTAGVFQSQQDIDDWIAAGNGVLQGNVQPGDTKYVDRDQNGVIDDDDKFDLGNGMPSYNYGFTVGFDWKGLDFSVTAYGAAGHKIVQAYRTVDNAKANYTTAVLKRWTGEGTSNSYPRVLGENNLQNWNFSDMWLQDGDYLRISNITLGYDFARLAKAKWLSKLRFYVSVQNPFTFTKYDGFDPEVGYGADTWCMGLDMTTYPHPRTYIVGANIKF